MGSGGLVIEALGIGYGIGKRHLAKLQTASISIP